jgi:branched-subunit amino acid transport protein AzlD
MEKKEPRKNIDNILHDAAHNLQKRFLFSKYHTISWWTYKYNYSDLKILHFVDRASCNDSCRMTDVTHKFLSMYLLLFLTLYTFRAHRAHHQERQIVSIQTLVAVILCWWPCRVQAGSSLPTCTRHSHQHRVKVTRVCIDTICLSWWWARCDRNV